MTVRERPERGDLRGLLFTLVAAVGLVTLWSTGPTSSGDQPDDGLTLVATTVGASAALLGAVWAVVGRALEGRALNVGPPVATVASAVLLVVATRSYSNRGLLGLTPDHTLAACLAAGLVVAAAMATTSTARLREVRRLRSEDATHDPEAPLT